MLIGCAIRWISLVTLDLSNNYFDIDEPSSFDEEREVGIDGLKLIIYGLRFNKSIKNMYLKSCFSQQEMNIYLECLDLVEEMFKYNLTLSIMKVTYYVNKIDSEFSDSESIDSDNLVSQSSNRAQFFERRS